MALSSTKQIAVPSEWDFFALDSIAVHQNTWVFALSFLDQLHSLAALVFNLQMSYVFDETVQTEADSILNPFRRINQESSKLSRK